MHIYKAEEWQSPTGKWLCGDVSAPAACSNYCWYPAAIMNLSPVEYVKVLINKYHAIDLHYSAKHDVLVFYFSTLADCRKYKNDINKLARQKNFITY